MNRIASRTGIAFAFAVSLSVSMPTTAQPVDADIKAAIYDIDRAGAQLPGLTPKKKAGIKRVERGLRMAEQRLEKSSNKTHPSWVAAKTKLDQYLGHIEQLKNPPQAVRPAPQPTATGSVSKPDTPAAATSARRAPAPDSKPSQAANQAPTEMPAYAQNKFRKLQRDTGSAAKGLKALDPKILHSQREVNKWHQRFKTLASNYRQFAQYESIPAVKGLRDQLQKMVRQYGAIEKKSLATFATLGDIAAQVQIIETHYKSQPLPAELDPPYTHTRAQAWAEHLRAFAGQADEHAKWLRHVQSTTNQYAMQVKNALNGTIGHRANGAIKTAITRTREAIYKPLNPIKDGGHVDVVAKLDPNDTNRIRNTLLGDGQYEALMVKLQDAERAIANGNIINKALNQPEAKGTVEARATIASHRKNIAALFERVLGEVRMPKAKSTDPKYVEALKQAFSRLDEPPAWERVVLNSEPTTRSESRAWWSGGVATIADYKWTEFQAATVEKVKDKYYIYYNTIHYYTSGSSKTPLNKWIVNRRFQSNRILKENIGK